MQGHGSMDEPLHVVEKWGAQFNKAFMFGQKKLDMTQKIIILGQNVQKFKH